MADETPSALDAVEDGPGSSDAGSDVASTGGELTTEHPSVTALRARFGDAVGRQEIPARGQTVVFVDRGRVREILGWLKEEPDQAYHFLSDVTSVDYGGGRPLQVVYQLWSLVHRRNLRVKAEVPVDDLRVPSVQPLWATANWLEREVFDLFGIDFEGHPDLRRILMPENYAEGHPLRKDFPLRGRFSRAEQTRRALSQEVADFYIPEEMELGREPQLVPGTDAPGTESGESA